MKALTYQGIKNVKVKDVPAPDIQKNDDIIVRITSTAICGSDLHLFHGMVPGMTDNYIIGHEPMGIVEEVGPDVTRVKKGDRVIVPFNVSCGQCYYCTHQMESQCDHSNSFHDTGAYLGYSEKYGGYPGGQAEFLRVPYGNFAPFVVPEDSELEDEKILFLSDIMPTAYWGVENAGVKEGDTVVVLGSGPVGLLAQKFCWIKGAKRVIAVDMYAYRLEHAKKINNVEAYLLEDEQEMGKFLNEITEGGADAVIDCVGMDGNMSTMEKAETLMKLQGGSQSAIYVASEAVRKFGTLSLIGVYGAKYNQFPLGRLFEKNLTIRAGQAPVIHYMPMLYDMVKNGEIDPSQIITHRLPLSEAEHGYVVFDNKKEDCVKVVLKP